MLLRVALFLIMAAGLAGFGAVAWISTRPPPPQPVSVVAAPVTVRVLAAVRTLRPGVLLKPDDLATAVLAQASVPEGASLDTPANRADLLGAMLRHTVLAGEVLLPMHVMRAGDRGFLAAVLGPGMRATTVGVDAVTGTAGLIWPGDHVDLLLTETIDNPGAPLGRRIAGETVLHNVRVIAIDQELMQGASASTGVSAPNSSQGRTVTLEVSPENAERVVVATRLGHLSLSVISADTSEPPMLTPVSTAAREAAPSGVRPRGTIRSGTPAVQVADPAPVTWGGDVSTALQSGPKGDPTNDILRVFEGSADGKEFHFR